jgi:hypothetical protein
LGQTPGAEFTIQKGEGSAENSNYWGTYSSMTVDPVDECTFWYVNEYETGNQSGKEILWATTIANFKMSDCSADTKNKNTAHIGPVQ